MAQMIRKKARDWTDRLFEPRDTALKINCQCCGVEMFIPPSKVGQRSHCTTRCAEQSRQQIIPAGDWSSRILEHRSGTVAIPCDVCGVSMAIPPSKLGRRYCSRACQEKLWQATRESNTRCCATCGSKFFSKKTAQKFCSQACNVTAREALNTEQSKVKAREGWLAALEEGRIRIPRGEEKWNWKGGPSAYRKRRQESGAEAAQLRAYRKNNPEKVREFADRRSNRKRSTGRLPRGTVANLMQWQKGKCAICRVNVSKNFHVDHIIPLAIGGKHEPRNLQILCAPCNVRKSAKDPIDYMQSLGRLL